MVRRRHEFVDSTDGIGHADRRQSRAPSIADATLNEDGSFAGSLPSSGMKMPSDRPEWRGQKISQGADAAGSTRRPDTNVEASCWGIGAHGAFTCCMLVAVLSLFINATPPLIGTGANRLGFESLGVLIAASFWLPRLEAAVQGASQANDRTKLVLLCAQIAVSGFLGLSAADGLYAAACRAIRQAYISSTTFGSSFPRGLEYLM